MKYHIVQLDSENIIASTYMRAYNRGALQHAAADLTLSSSSSSSSSTSSTSSSTSSTSSLSSSCDIVGLSCTSFSFAVGINNVRDEFLKGGYPFLQNTTDMASAQIDGIRAVGTAIDGSTSKIKVALLTPYIEEVSKANARLLENAGFQVVARLTMNLPRDELTSKVSPEEIALWAKKVRCDSNCDVVVIGCSAFRACPFPGYLDELERELGKPVVTSTQAFLWKMLRGAGRYEKIDGYGKLFSEK
jgi:maleate isomerase